MKRKNKHKQIKNMKDARGNYFVKGDVLISSISKKLIIQCIKINKKGGLFKINDSRLKKSFFISKGFMRTCLWVRI